MPRGGAVALALLVGGFARTFPAESVARAQLNAAPVAPDSAAVLRRAEKAQRTFEAKRRSALPRPVIELGSGTPCDAQIGRFCYWYAAPFDDPPPEPAEIHDARTALLHDLGEAGEALPGDDWIAGQRVRYLIEQGLPDLARAVARRCAGTRWWCAALAGYAEHAAGDFAAADSTYAAALAAMPEEERCRWTDLGVLLDEDAGRYEKLSCAERAAANARIWWLADPLLSVPGNELRTEHYARVTVSRTLRHGDTPHGLAWADDMHDLIVRYGWPIGWSRAFPRPGGEEAPVTGHDPSPSYWFFPVPPLPPETREGQAPVGWDLERAKPPARFAPPYAAAFGTIGRAQFARFRAAGGAVTVAAYDLRGDTLVGGPDLRLTLAVSLDPKTPAVVGPPAEGGAGVLVLRSAFMPGLVSLEARVADQGHVARARALAPEADSTPGPALSDLLLIRARPDRGLDSLGAAAPAALPVPVVRAGAALGLYWEIYDVPPGAPVRFEVRAERRGGGRPPGVMGSRECGGHGRAQIRVAWQEDAPARHPGPGRSVALDLSHLSPGAYHLTVSASGPGGPAACSSRDLDIRD
jgi:hypothetical protein